MPQTVRSSTGFYSIPAYSAYSVNLPPEQQESFMSAIRSALPARREGRLSPDSAFKAFSSNSDPFIFQCALFKRDPDMTKKIETIRAAKTHPESRPTVEAFSRALGKGFESPRSMQPDSFSSMVPTPSRLDLSAVTEESSSANSSIVSPDSK